MGKQAMVAEYIKLERSVSERDDRVIAGRYRLGTKLGSGAMGAVWVATDERLNRTVAVKVLLLPAGLNETETERARQRALREGRIAARIRHANAIAVYDVVDEGGSPVLIMEYLPSRSLAEVLHERGALPPREVAHIGAQVAAALTEAHAVGIVHRDVKPANILLGDNGDIKLADFGISRAVGDVTVTATGLLAGTPAYLSPEAARGGDPDPASDVFSLGATLYRAVEGVPPFGGNSDNAIAVLHAVASGKIDPPRKAGELSNALTLMMRTDSRARPAMGQVHRELVAVAGGRVSAVAMEPAPEGPTRAITTGTMPRVTTRTDLSPVRYSDEGEPPPAEPRPRRRTYLAMVMAALAVAAVLAVLLIVQDRFGQDRAGQPGAPSTSAPVSVSAAEFEQAVSEYYALMPDDTDAGWERLGPGLRKQGKEKYERFWGTVSSVEVLQAPEADGNTVVVKLELVKDNGRYHEVHELGMVTADGKALIDSDKLVSSKRQDVEQNTPPPQTRTQPHTTQPSPHTTEPTETTTSEQTETSEPSEQPTDQPTGSPQFTAEQQPQATN